MAVVGVISDTQFPFEHPDAFDFMCTVEETFHCTEMVHIGDEFDFHRFGRYIKDPDLPGESDELHLAVEHARPWYKRWPKMKLCLSNHGDRLMKVGVSAGLPRRLMKTMQQVMDAPPGWRWAPYWEIDGVRYEHGDMLFGRYGGGKSALVSVTEKIMQSTVFGHASTVFGVRWSRTPARRIFAMGVGCLIDETRHAFNYSGRRGSKREQLGAGVVVDGVPFAIPMIVDERNRWVGELYR